MKRFLPEALFFASAAVVLAILRLDAFGDASEMLLFMLLVFLGVWHTAIPVTLAVAALALKFKRRGAAVVAPILGAALVICAYFLWFTLSALHADPKMTEFYWGGLGIVPIVAIGVFIAARMRESREVGLSYAVGGLLLAATYFVTPWASDVVLALIKGPALQLELATARGREAYATYDYTYGFPDEGQEDLLIYDPADATTNAVLTRFRESDHCGLHGLRIFGLYYAIHYVIDSRC